MDNFQKNKEVYDTVVNSFNSAIDLTEGLDNPSDSVKLLAEKLFSMDQFELKNTMFGLIFDGETKTGDVCCALIELILIGLEMNNIKNIFNVSYDSIKETITELNKYLYVIGYCMDVDEIKTDGMVNQYIADYHDLFYCRIINLPPEGVLFTGWKCCDYGIVGNRNFVETEHLNSYKIFFVNKQRNIITIKFDCVD